MSDLRGKNVTLSKVCDTGVKERNEYEKEEINLINNGQASSKFKKHCHFAEILKEQ